MLYALIGYLHAAAHRRVRGIRAPAEGERGQVGMVAAMKGFNRQWLLGAYRPSPVRARREILRGRCRRRTSSLCEPEGKAEATAGRAGGS